jgi:Holliday junction DNA helicase RuvB
MNVLRPTKLCDLIGQTEVIHRLKISIDAAKERGEALPHAILGGPPGIGKTSIALAMANELEVPIQVANGANVRSLKKLLPYLMRTTHKSILFIDEIHRCTKIVEEFLYPVMEDFTVCMDQDEDMSFELSPFTLIGATTNTGALSAPFRDRFVLKYNLELYSDLDLFLILKKSAISLGLKYDPNAFVRLAQASRGTPRVANAYLQWVRDFAGQKTITDAIVCEAMKMSGVEPDGLTKQDKMYMDVLKQYKRQPVGIKTISRTINISEETIEEQIEPFLLRKKMILKTGNGRILA